MLFIGYIAYQSHVYSMQHQRKMENLHSEQIDLIGSIQKQNKKTLLLLDFENTYNKASQNIRSEIVTLQNVLLKSVTNQNNS